METERTIFSTSLPWDKNGEKNERMWAVYKWSAFLSLYHFSLRKHNKSDSLAMQRFHIDLTWKHTGFHAGYTQMITKHLS